MRDGRDIEQAPSLGDRPTDPLECVECGTLSTVNASGWRGYRTDEPETDDLPELLFYCPSCAEREFG